MAKKKHEHGKLYQHALRELDLAGLSEAKGGIDQKLRSTVLRLIDTVERGAAGNEFVQHNALQFFTALANGRTLTQPTNSPDEWKPVPGLGDKIFVNTRDNTIHSQDAGISYYSSENASISGLSLEVHKEETDGSEKEEGIQSDASERPTK